MKLSRNVVWNTVGSTLPVLVGVAAVPLIIRGLGVSRFGVLSVIWMVIGYFSIFDFGLGRTLTKMVADRIGGDRAEEVPALVSTTLILVTISGAVMGLVLALLTPWIADHALRESLGMAREVAAATFWLAISLPFVLVSASLIGLLEAYQEFALINAVRVPTGALTYLAPLAVLHFSNHLGPVTAALSVVRIVSVSILGWLCFRTVPSLRDEPFGFHKNVVRPMVTYGGWLTVSNVVGPVMVYFDRFLIAIVLGSAAVAYYTVPYDVLTRLWIFPTAIQGVLFPAFAVLHVQRSPRLTAVFGRSTWTTLLLLTPVLFATMLLGHDGLQIWVGSAFAYRSTVVAKILIIGVLINSLARAPGGFVQGIGYAKWTAVLHICELPVYFVFLWWALRAGGIEGAAIAWTARITADAVVVYLMAVRLEGGLRHTAIRDLFLTLILCAAAVASDAVPSGLLIRGGLVVVLCGICGMMLLKSLRGAATPASRDRVGNTTS